MGGYYGMAVLVGVALLLKTGQCDAGCRGTDGQPGAPGAPGRDGNPGVKGEKGEPAVVDGGAVDGGVLVRLKGEAGSRGLQGIPGPKGFRGLQGRAGDPGAHGLPGPGGQLVSPQPSRSAFSVIRSDNSYPPFNQVVTFQSAVVNTLQDFNVATGHFVCRVAGVYYFTFNSVAKVSMCLRIASNALTNKLGFCDYNRNSDQVLSGGVVLTLTAGQKVWLESFEDRQRVTETQDVREKRIIFSGFLLF